ncbi:MAG: D-aminoacyl-tRNA deacylase [Desulfovibrionaceae bacterium]
MRFLIQRVSEATVHSGGELLGRVAPEHAPGLLVLAGFGMADTMELPESPAWEKMLDKLLDLRILSDSQGKLNLSLRDTGGGLLLVSQFTLYADCRKGRRPSFAGFSAPPALAEQLYDSLVRDLRERHTGPVETGRFGAEMQIGLVNDGPVTIALDSADFSS